MRRVMFWMKKHWSSELSAVAEQVFGCRASLSSLAGSPQVALKKPLWMLLCFGLDKREGS